MLKKHILVIILILCLLLVFINIYNNVKNKNNDISKSSGYVYQVLIPIFYDYEIELNNIKDILIDKDLDFITINYNYKTRKVDYWPDSITDEYFSIKELKDIKELMNEMELTAINKDTNIYFICGSDRNSYSYMFSNNKEFISEFRYTINENWRLSFLISE